MFVSQNKDTIISLLKQLPHILLTGSGNMSDMMMRIQQLNNQFTAFKRDATAPLDAEDANFQMSLNMLTQFKAHIHDRTDPTAIPQVSRFLRELICSFNDDFLGAKRKDASNGKLIQYPGLSLHYDHITVNSQSCSLTENTFTLSQLKYHLTQQEYTNYCLAALVDTQHNALINHLLLNQQPHPIFSDLPTIQAIMAADSHCSLYILLLQSYFSRIMTLGEFYIFDTPTPNESYFIRCLVAGYNQYKDKPLTINHLFYHALHHYLARYPNDESRALNSLKQEHFYSLYNDYLLSDSKPATIPSQLKGIAFTYNVHFYFDDDAEAPIAELLHTHYKQLLFLYANALVAQNKPESAIAVLKQARGTEIVANHRKWLVLADTVSDIDKKIEKIEAGTLKKKSSSFSFFCSFETPDEPQTQRRVFNEATLNPLQSSINNVPQAPTNVTPKF